jgi:hypothetical protein
LASQSEVPSPYFHCGGIDRNFECLYRSVELKMPRTLLLSRLALIVAAVVGASWLSAAHAQSDNERQQMLFGGAPRAKNYNFFGFGGTDATRTKVSYSGRETPGTIVVNTAERRLYLVQNGGSALRYSIGVGRVGFQWKGTHKVSAKKEWPGWTPPPEMRARQRWLPVHMAGGEGNPLGARADVSRQHALSHPRLQRSGLDRSGGVVGLLPHDQRRRQRPVRARGNRNHGDRAVSRFAPRD